jgi:outer membrane protein assembly factor BamB
MKKGRTTPWCVVVLGLAGLLSGGLFAEEQEKATAAEVAHGLSYGGGVKLFEPYTEQARTQYRDLGIAPFDVIPAADSSITALAVAPDGDIYGGTTGATANLFAYSPGYNFAFPLGTIPGEESVYHSLVMGGDGYLYIGTTRNPDKEYQVDTSIITGPNAAYTSVTIQIMRDFQAYAGGHLYRYKLASTQYRFHQKYFKIDEPCELEDLGIPVPHEGIYTLLKDRSSDTIYGLTYPGSHLFRYDMASGETTVITDTNPQMPLGNEVPMISKALVQDAAGNIYCNTYGGKLLRYRPETGEVEELDVRLPGMKGRWIYNAIECAQLHPNGTIYGGTTDGYVFGFDPKTETMSNYGKPVIEVRVRAMTVGADGRIYGIGGEDRIGMSRLFVFDPEAHTFEDLGIVQVSHVPYMEWTGLIFDAMVTGHDGSLYLGEAEYRGKLFIYVP